MEYSRICEAKAFFDTAALEKARQALGASIPFAQYRETVLTHTPLTEGLAYDAPAGSAHARWLPRMLCSLGTAATQRVIRFASLVNVNGEILSRSLQISAQAFAGNTTVTDILLPPSMQGLPPAAFKGCSKLRRLTFPRSITHIEPDTFTGCDSLTDVYYEGGREEWDKLKLFCRERRVIKDVPGQPVLIGDVVLPGYEALLTAHIHYSCDFSHSEMPPKKLLRASALPAGQEAVSIPASQKASDDRNEATGQKGKQPDTGEMQQLDEKMLCRLMRGYDRYGYAIISASAVGNSAEQQQKCAEEMKRNLMALHYSFLPLYGSCAEDSGEEVLGRALLVLPMNRTVSCKAPVELFAVFKKDMIALAKLYGQEAVLLSQPDLPPTVYDCVKNSYETPFSAKTDIYTAVQRYFMKVCDRKRRSKAAADSLHAFVYIPKQPETLSGAHGRALQHEIIVYGTPE